MWVNCKFQKILILLPELIHKRWMFHSIGEIFCAFFKKELQFWKKKCMYNSIYKREKRPGSWTDEMHALSPHIYLLFFIIILIGRVLKKLLHPGNGLKVLKKLYPFVSLQYFFKKNWKDLWKWLYLFHRWGKMASDCSCFGTRY